MFCSSLIVQDAITWSPKRSNVTEPTGGYSFAITIDESRYPVLEAFRKAIERPRKFWSGEINIREMVPSRRSPKGLSRANRDEIFGFPAFIFDDVEILGFRIDLSRRRNSVNQMVSRLYGGTQADTIATSTRHG